MGMEQFCCNSPAVRRFDKGMIVCKSLPLPFLYYFCYSSCFCHIQNVNVIRRFMLWIWSTFIDKIKKALYFMSVFIWVNATSKNHSVFMKIRSHDRSVAFITGFQILFYCGNNFVAVRKVGLIHSYSLLSII